MTEIFERFDTLNVLVIGDVMLDNYVWGKVERISPEAPVPIVKVNKTESRLGGAANVALNIQALGATPIICAIVGDDKEGQELLALMENQGLSTRCIVEMKSRCTTVKTRVIAHKQQIVRIDTETDDPLSPQLTDVILARLRSILESESIDAIIFEDYDKGLVTEHLITQVVEIARSKGIITVVDPKKSNFLHYRKVSLFKPNLKELKDGLKIDLDPENFSEIQAAVKKLKELLETDCVMLTLSEHGVYICTESGDQLTPAHIRNIADVSGAGDTVIATAALCLAAGMDHFNTAAVANLAGGLVCEHVGVVPVNKADLLREVRIALKQS